MLVMRDQNNINYTGMKNSTSFPNSINLIIIIIMSCCLHGFPSLLPSVYHPLLSAGLSGYILFLYRAVILHLHKCEEVHRRISLMSLSLPLQQWYTRLVRLIWMVFEMGGRWLYSCCFIGYCFQDLIGIQMLSQRWKVTLQFTFKYSDVTK